MPGCAFCNLLQRDEVRYLDSLLYEYVNTPDTNDAFRAARGLCAEHNARLKDYGASVLGIAILQAAVLDELLKITTAQISSNGSAMARLFGGEAKKGAAILSQRLEPVAPCLVCETLAQSTARYATALTEHITETPLAEAYRQSEGLCLPHFRAVLRLTSNAASLESLISIQITIWQDLKAQLDDFARKYDVNHADQKMGAEGDSWLRALRLIAGEPRIFGLRTAPKR